MLLVDVVKLSRPKPEGSKYCAAPATLGLAAHATTLHATASPSRRIPRPTAVAHAQRCRTQRLPGRLLMLSTSMFRCLAP
jgi:hypothetical protein